MSLFRINQATISVVPVIISVPHCGTAFPDELKDQYKQELIAAPDDTDWFVDKLYDFAPALGITMISAEYSRWVIDLNRDPHSKPLYTDGRIITGLCPTTTFSGKPIYKDERQEVEIEEVKRRLENYYWPYQLKLQELLSGVKEKFGKVLLWDCHSIRQEVATIHKGKFPDLILGDADGASAAPALIETAYKNLASGPYSISHNFPFKGGYITRNYGKPLESEQALQLEMTKVNYMDNEEREYDLAKAEKMREILKNTLEKLIDQLMN